MRVIAGRSLLETLVQFSPTEHVEVGYSVEPEEFAGDSGHSVLNRRKRRGQVVPEERLYQCRSGERTTSHDETPEGHLLGPPLDVVVKTSEGESKDFAHALAERLSQELLDLERQRESQRLMIHLSIYWHHERPAKHTRSRLDPQENGCVDLPDDQRVEDHEKALVVP